MSSDSAHPKRAELIKSYKDTADTPRASIKRRTKSERRRRERNRPKQRTSPKDILRTSLSEDSGAGGEDEGSASDDDLNDTLDGRQRRPDSSDKRKRQLRSNPHQSVKYLTGGPGDQVLLSKPETLTATDTNGAQKTHLRSQHSGQNDTSDSAISTSIVSTSAISTSAESPFVSSPNLSDHSKGSSFAALRSRSPELSRALRRKQEKIKRQLDLRETRARLERLRFTEKAYHNNSNRMMFMTSSLSRRRNNNHTPKSAGSSSGHRARSPNPQSFPVGNESRRLLSKGRSSLGTSPIEIDHESKPERTKKEIRSSVQEGSSFGDRYLSSENARQILRDSSRSPVETTSASSPQPRFQSSTLPEPTLRHSSCSNENVATSSTTFKDIPDNSHSPSSKSIEPTATTATTTTTTTTTPSTRPGKSEGSGEEKTKHRSSSRRRREGSSRRRHRDASSKERHASSADVGKERIHAVDADSGKHAQRSSPEAGKEKSLRIPEIQTNGLSDSPSSQSPRTEDDFEKVARRLESSPRDGAASTTNSSAAEKVETRMTHAMDAILRDGMPDMPSMDEITERGLMDWRAVFRVEMMRLRREVNEFRMFCNQQIELHALVLEKSWHTTNNNNNNNTNNNNNNVKDKEPETESRQRDAPKVTEQLKDLETNMKLFQRKQLLLDQETELLEKEEQLSEKVKHLEEYEKEILEVESMLNQRQAICDRRQRALVNLDEELQALRHELEETKDHMNSDGSIPESNSEKARKNWDMVRRNLMDKQQLLETTVQKYRSELASATSTIAGKDILISRLQSAAMHHDEEVANRDKRIQQLESKLTIALSETRNLSEQLSGASRRGSLSVLGRGEGDFHAPSSSFRRPSNDTTLDHSHRSSFRSSTGYYRRPSSNAGSEQGGDDYGSKTANGTVGGGDSTAGFGDSSRLNGPRMSRKRNSVSDNAISRLTLTTPRTDDKFGRGSSACTVQ